MMQIFLYIFESRAWVVKKSLSASSFYVPSEVQVASGSKQPTVMQRGGDGSGALTPRQAPPDLPSLLLDSGIAHVGMPLVTSFTD